MWENDLIYTGNYFLKDYYQKNTISVARYSYNHIKKNNNNNNNNNNNTKKKKKKKKNKNIFHFSKMRYRMFQSNIKIFTFSSSISSLLLLSLISGSVPPSDSRIREGRIGTQIIIWEVSSMPVKYKIERQTVLERERETVLERERGRQC